MTTGNGVAAFFCSVCGTVMNRKSAGFEGKNFLRIGTGDGFNLQATALKPKTEQFVKDRFGWVRGVKGPRQVEGFSYA